jgi:hypothetical protein
MNPMPNYDIDALKNQQDVLDRRNDELRASVRPFNDALFQTLKQFADDAIKAGLRGVKPLRFVLNTDDFIEATISLNSFDLIFASTTDALTLDLESSVMASKMFIYDAASDQFEPFAEIVIKEGPKPNFQFEVSWHTRKGAQPLLFSNLGQEAGTVAADILIAFFYSFKRAWHERPTLAALRLKKHAEKPVGFSLP